MWTGRSMIITENSREWSFIMKPTTTSLTLKYYTLAQATLGQAGGLHLTRSTMENRNKYPTQKGHHFDHDQWSLIWVTGSKFWVESSWLLVLLIVQGLVGKKFLQYRTTNYQYVSRFYYIFIIKRSSLHSPLLISTSWLLTNHCEGLHR